MKTPVYTKLLIIFSLSFIIKAVISFAMEGPFIFSDEPCVIQRAFHLATYGKIDHCSTILGFNAGDTQPLYSIIISPFYYFFSKITAYRLTLILNAFLTASLIFPLFSIFKKFLKSEKNILLSTVLIIFLPQITTFEKMVMTEMLFAVISIWFLHFYLLSFEKNKTSNKIISFIIAILATIARPFGFIVPIAMIINEFFLAKDRKKIALIYIPLGITVLTAFVAIFFPALIEIVHGRLAGLENPENLKYIGKAMLQQLNSFSIGTMVVPLIIFISYLNKKDSTYLVKIKVFLISIIILNFLISSQHVYGYFLENLNPNAITRYINLSLILIFIFSLIFIQRYKEFKLEKKNIFISLIIFIPLLFFNYKKIKHSLNLDLAIYYDTFRGTRDNLVMIKEFILFPVIGLIVSLFILLIKNKRKLIMIILSITIMLQAGFSYKWVTNFSAFSSNTIDYLEYKKAKILFLGKEDKEDLEDLTYWRILELAYWRLLSLSENEITVQMLEGTDSLNEEVQLPEEIAKPFQDNFDYLITRFKLNLPLEKVSSPDKSSHKEYIYKL